MIDRNKLIWEGWTVGTFIDELEWLFDMIMSDRSHVKKFTTKGEVKIWCKSEQPYYKKHIPEVYEYFVRKAGL